MLCWGLIPSWTNDLKIRHQCNNAKAETMAENSSLRAAFKIRPCRVIATGFYEWQVEGCAKPPMRIGLKSQCFFPFAGLWDLGYCAVQCLLDGGTAAMVSIQHGRCTPIPFTQMVDSVSGRANVRKLDITAQSWQIARQCMIRLSEVGASRIPRHLADARPRGVVAGGIPKPV